MLLTTSSSATKLLLVAWLMFSGITYGTQRQMASGAGRGPVSVTGVSHGLRITLTVDRHSYPRRVLISATVRVQNVSGHLITAKGTSCSQMNPSVVSMGAHGRILFPNGVKWLNLIPCSGPTTEDSYMGPGFETDGIRDGTWSPRARPYGHSWKSLGRHRRQCLRGYGYIFQPMPRRVSRSDRNRASQLGSHRDSRFTPS